MSLWTILLLKYTTQSEINPVTPTVHKLVKHTLKVFEQMLQDF